MDKKDMRKIQLLAVLIIFLIPVITSSLLDLKQQKEQAAAYQALLSAQEIQRIAEKKNYLMGKFNPGGREDFVLIPKEHTTLSVPMYLRQEAYDAFLKMSAAAKLDGIKLRIASATRNFDYQKVIWDNKWSGATLVDGENLAESITGGPERFQKILEYSAAPGTSRHHWGTDIDVYYAIPAFFETGKGKKIYDWLVVNAPTFGFCQVYNEKGTDQFAGYHEEKWHWSYLPLARNLTQEYKTLITLEDLDGVSFLGSEFVPENLINDYVLSINPECL
ncbi:M15 family metallopeptidase [Candidatus Nomurabacteria bacterium]|nr:M15 family metallopeptidase [Candidatus Nomurabacteria bacterium]